jgi:hypothetical protein
VKEERVTDLVVFSIFIFLFCSLLFYSVNLKIKNLSLTKKNLQLAIDRNIFADRLLEEMRISETKSVENTDGFLKFVSESRDWAFAYIEDVQEGINTFISEVEPEIEYFDEYGIVGDAYPHYFSMKKISEAYKKLKSLVPDDYGKIDT